MTDCGILIVLVLLLVTVLLLVSTFLLIYTLGITLILAFIIRILVICVSFSENHSRREGKMSLSYCTINKL
jgi:hypothetical protein